MNLSSSTILVTGGASGIGLALATRFAKLGSTVVVCGRREDVLAEAKKKGLETIRADVATEADRVELAKQATTRFPKLNVLVNNAGIQRRAPFSADTASWSEREKEIAINFAAPAHLAALLIPHLEKQKDAAIVNVTSGLAFVPGVFAPVYCATKAAMHSLSVSMRHDLKRKSIEVIEIVPPMVNTDLGGKGLHDEGVPLDEFADAMLEGLKRGETEIGYGFSEKARNASRAELDAISAGMAQRQ
jgi:uncharacterized oxidoreductase